ncbi:MAG TPA: glycogen debranching N-terminal domain-containing protein [Myxococcaceae bacterium]|nr:glycogen debranching N-terminal domain-containing protein [Myxococcaceae bacterium]
MAETRVIQGHDELARVLMHQDTFAVFDRGGAICSESRQEQGVYHHGTRHVSRLELRIDGQRPLTLSSGVVRDNALLAVDLTNPELARDGRAAVPHGTIHLFRGCVLEDGVCHQRLRVHNFSVDQVVLELRLLLEADFVDVFEVRGTPRRRRGTLSPPEIHPDGIGLAYHGLDGVLRRTRLRCRPAPGRVNPTDVRYFLTLSAGEERELSLEVSCAHGPAEERTSSYSVAAARRDSELERLREAEARVRSSSGLFDGWLDRSLADLRMLVTRKHEGLYPYAGVPWYSTPFGRDGIITALQMLWVQPEVAAGVLRFLAATQATHSSVEDDAEPGKIVHEIREGEMAALGEVPFRRYYGAVDTTPLFLVLAGDYLHATGDLDLVKELWPSFQAAMGWIEKYGDQDGDGFVEYVRRSSRGLTNQGWKDSGDAIFHADGRLVEGPIALCEVQGYVHAARRAMAGMARALGDGELAARQETLADELRARFENAYWCEDLSTYALALDGEKRPCRVRSSNPGHCLAMRMVSADRARKVAATLTGEPFFSGWGIRTIARGEPRYNPMSYHDGSVWPHDNALAALGFAHYGLKDSALAVLERFFEASLFFELGRMPELFCGFPRRPDAGPTLYPVACSPQAWASGAVLMLLRATLGLDVDGVNGRVTFSTPVLPSFLEVLHIDGLAVGTSRVDLRVHRYADGAAGVDVARRSGPVKLSIHK